MYNGSVLAVLDYKRGLQSEGHYSHDRNISKRPVLYLVINLHIDLSLIQSKSCDKDIFAVFTYAHFSFKEWTRFLICSSDEKVEWLS